MIEAVPLKAEHVEWLKERGGLGYLAQYVDRDKLEQLEKTHAFTLISPVGGVLACAGILEFWPGRGELWAMFNPRCKEQFLRAHRILERLVKNHPCKRMEAVVDEDFAPGHRWIRLLGDFHMEAVMRSYSPNGKDAVLYSRIKGD